MVDVGGIWTKDERKRISGDDIKKGIDKLDLGHIPILDEFDEYMYVRDFPKGRSLFVRPEGITTHNSDGDSYLMVFTVRTDAKEGTITGADEPSSFQFALQYPRLKGRDIAYRVLRRSTADNYRWNRWEELFNIGDIASLNHFADNLVEAINNCNTKQQPLLDGERINQLIVDALVKKGVSASVGDTIRTNVQKVNLITRGNPIGLSPVTNLTATGVGTGRVKLSWESPRPVIYEGVEVSSLKQDILVRKEGSSPESIDDGVVVVKSGFNDYKDEPFVDTGIMFETLYYYRVFSISTDDATIKGKEAYVFVRKSTPLRNLPVGAKIKDPNSKYYGEPIVWMKLEDNHYNMDETTLLSEQIICLKAYDAKEPNNGNSNRRNYGNNRYMHSNLRQWLNSSASNWYSAQHSADAPPTSSGVSYNAYDKEKGFMANLTPELRSAILPTSLKVTKNPVDGGGLESFTDKIFIPSCTEVGLSNDTSYDEGTKFDYFKSYSDRVATTTKECVENSDYTSSRLKPDDTWYWWTRTPYSSASDPEYVRIVYDDGSRNHNSPYDGYWGVRPALNLDSSVTVLREPDSDGVYILNI